MTISQEISYETAKQRMAIIFPVASSTLGYFAGSFAQHAANNHDTNVNNLELSVQKMINEYRMQEQRMEKVVDSIPGLNLWMKGYEKLFGEAQNTALQTTEFTKLTAEELNFEFLKAPKLDYTMLGASLGLALGLYKMASVISNARRQKKLLRLIKNEIC